jgi:hypothetical protein
MGLVRSAIVVRRVERYFAMYMNNVFNPSDKAGCVKIPSSRAV